MASEAEASEIASFFERIVRERDLSLFVPFILGLASATPRTDPENPDQENPGRSTPRERLIFINPFAQTMMVVEGDSLQELGMKDGQPPASKASIDAMPCVRIVEGHGGSECVICLEQFEIDGVAKEMPCKHRFHGCCIEKWLKIHGSCPVCRYNMPVDEEETGKKSDGADRERRVEGEIRVSFYVQDSTRASEDSEQTPSGDFNASDSSSSPAADHDDMQS
ncbi:E3 ubiquitin-protein ligase RING1-like [Prunus yedoensis var. nudiflora]|uniref:RING-type E3 ubiquitin transferase n=1 Tax=Prunus yedoensis var. nudiflora TaxID=2094558 RepID=A0A314ZMW3_PRUYE|nr:E3 ubiquitin-protein ligase RING1-like [Prunus yedoensis var. nudiflora]